MDARIMIYDRPVVVLHSWPPIIEPPGCHHLQAHNHHPFLRIHPTINNRNNTLVLKNELYAIAVHINICTSMNRLFLMASRTSRSLGKEEIFLEPEN